MVCEEIHTKNNIYQHFYVLKTNRNKRHRYGEFLVEGVRNLNEAVTGEWKIKALLRKPLVLMIGNETAGLCHAFKMYCDELLTIPMKEGACATSFNVSCAASVMMYEVMRQRREKG